MTSKEALTMNNHIDVKLRLLANKKHRTNYPPLEVGDRVKTYKKKELARTKERCSVWSQSVYTIESISEQLGQKVYKLTGLAKKYLRHELFESIVSQQQPGDPASWL